MRLTLACLTASRAAVRPNLLRQQQQLGLLLQQLGSLYVPHAVTESVFFVNFLRLDPFRAPKSPLY